MLAKTMITTVAFGMFLVVAPAALVYTWWTGEGERAAEWLAKIGKAWENAANG